MVAKDNVTVQKAMTVLEVNLNLALVAVVVGTALPVVAEDPVAVDRAHLVEAVTAEVVVGDLVVQEVILMDTVATITLLAVMVELITTADKVLHHLTTMADKVPRLTTMAARVPVQQDLINLPLGGINNSSHRSRWLRALVLVNRLLNLISHSNGISHNNNGNNLMLPISSTHINYLVCI